MSTKPLAKMTPTHQALAVIRQTIKTLELQYQELAATLPPAKKEKKLPPGKRFITHPITGEKKYY